MVGCCRRTFSNFFVMDSSTSVLLEWNSDVSDASEKGSSSCLVLPVPSVIISSRAECLHLFPPWEMNNLTLQGQLVDFPGNDGGAFKCSVLIKRKSPSCICNTCCGHSLTVKASLGFQSQRTEWASPSKQGGELKSLLHAESSWATKGEKRF